MFGMCLQQAMRHFSSCLYKNLTKNQPMATAFYNAQKKMRKKFDPVNWAGFILVES